MDGKRETTGRTSRFDRNQPDRGQPAPSKPEQREVEADERNGEGDRVGDIRNALIEHHAVFESRIPVRLYKGVQIFGLPSPVLLESGVLVIR